MLLAVMLMTAMTGTAQNTTDDKNKAIIETTDGSHELNTDEISVIRFDGGKVTVVHSEGETTFDRTLRSLSFQRPNPGTLLLTATTSIGTGGSGNRAQTIDDGKLKATWADGDVVYVYADASSTTSIGTLTPKTYGEKTTTLTGNINATGLENSQMLYFSTQPRPFDFSAQDGTVENLFYFTATAPVTINGGNASVSDLDFTRPFAVVKFTLKNKTDAAISAKSFTVHDGTNTCTVTPTAATNVLYVGIPDIDTKTLTLTATDGNDYYLYQRAGVTFANNLYYPVTVKMQASDLARPLTFEAKTEGTIVIENPKSGMQYSLNGGAKTQVPASIDVDKDDKVQFYGHGTSITSYDGTQIAGGSAECYVYGNIMSLVDEGSYATNTTLTDDHTFDGLFYNNTNICNHATKALLLPATTLAKCCYEAMFYGCTNLTTAPELPAATLTESCYAYMFQGCENLNSVTCLAADISATECTYSWLSNVATTGTFVKLESMADWESVGGIPLSWTVKSYEKLLPLTFEAKTAGATVTFTEGANVEGISPLEYSTDGKTWSTYTSGTAITITNAGDKVSFRGNNETYAAGSSDNCNFSCTAGCYVYGNIMSLINKDNFATNTTLTGSNTFTGLFAKNDYLYNHADKTLLLPATTLTVNCYQDMFQGCTSLTTAPALPATTLTENCYNGMFHGCTSLTKAPVLPATTLATGCYYIMFQGCENLNSVTCLATDISADGCTTNWLDGVAAAGMFYKAPDANWTTGASGIPSGWTTENLMLVIPLTFKAKEAGATVTFTKSTGINDLSIEYSLNGGAWTAYSSTITLEHAGDRVSFRGDNATYATSDTPGYYSNFSCTAGCYVYGNIMSLVDKDKFATNTALTGHYAFAGLFAGNTNIDIHADKALLLPATTLTYGCYKNMFQGCTGLTTAPALPATTLTNHCYDNMFQGCTSLTTAPALPATTLAERCYYEMFKGCTKLNNVTCLATDINVPYCTTNWLDGVAATGMFYKAPDANWTTGANGIPSGWTTKNYMLATPLVFEAKTAGAQVTFQKNSQEDPTPTIGIEYSYDGLNWTTYTEPITLTNVGDKLFFRGKNNSYNGHLFSCSAECYVYGNIMSLVDKDNFATNTTLTGDDTFNGLFAGNTNIYNHADKALLLPATTLTDGCYKNMFQGCTSLTTAPTLPATTLVKDCYAGMFQGCTSLNSVTCLAADISATDCTTNWLDDVAATGMFFKSESMKNWTTGPSGIPCGWTAMSYEMMHTPLTFEANEVGATVSFTSTLKTPPTVEYSKNGGAWTTYTEPIELTNVGDKVSFRGNNATYATNNRNSKFSCSADCYVYGNIMSLVSSTGFATATELTAAYTFCELFCDGNNSKHIKNHSTKSLCLPATTLTNDCYNSMFTGCTSLTTAPALPATTLAEKCYACMFSDCTSLTTAPVLPATTLAEECYSGMFWGCTGLTTAPALPATTLAEECYSFMFWNCTNLTTAPALPATTLAEGCYSSMFFNCTSLTTAPALPATTLVKDCYKTMFQYCKKLNNVTCLATDISAEGCTTDWLEEVAATGTFYKPESMDNWTTGDSGIPSGWTAKDAMLATPLTFEAKTAGAQVTFTKSTDIDNLPVEYSLNGGAWKTYDAPISLAKVGDKVSFRGNNKTYAAGSSKYSTFSCSDDCYIYGNIMSLIDKDNFATNTTLTDANAFAFNGLFMNNTHIYNHADNALLLPATTLIHDCYANMFYGCTGLTKAPALPATTLAESCYYCMFQGCTNLTTAPALPAETLSPSCYTCMFYGCTSLATAPALPAETLSGFCYYGMFYGCTSLTTTPTLPAATLVSSCYEKMFYGCTSLNSVTCMATDITATGCTTNWLYDVAATGTFYKHPYANWPRDNGIPDGWTVIDIGSISYATTEVNKTTADAAFTNEVSHYGNGPVTYAVTSGDDICTVNATTGEVTLNATVGSCTITATVTDIPSCIYPTKTASYTLTVTPAMLSVTASDYNGTYDGTAHGITVTCDGATIKYRTTDSGEYDLTENPTYSTVGTYTVYYQVTRDKYPTVTGSNTVSISKAMLTATAADASRDYGSNNPTFTVNVTGFVNGETAATAAGYTAPTASTVATPSSNVGDYAITPSGGSATNYDFTYVNGTLTINKVDPTYTAPTAKTGLTFTGSAQTLIYAGSATGGTMYYSLNNSNWYTSVDDIKKTNANTSGYTVYYKVVGDENHNDVAPASINVPIAKANGICTLSSYSSSGWRAGLKERTETITVTHHYGGTLTATSSNSAITVFVSGDKVTISREALDVVITPVTITVTCAETTNYKAASATYTCNQ